MEFHVIIPARLESTRLPDKAIAKIGDRTMLQHVYDRAVESGAESIIVATDNKKIAKIAESFGASVCMTSPDHTSGTERIAEAVVALGFEDEEIIVNVQCDVPLIPPSLIKDTATALDQHDNVKVTTACVPIGSIEELFNPDVVKVVPNKRNYAMYFSRAPIPWNQKHAQEQEKINLKNHHFRHVGIYAYHAGFLQEYMERDRSPYEDLEALEQLRILWNGGRIHLLHYKGDIPHSVDTQDDLDSMRKLIKK